MIGPLRVYGRVAVRRGDLDSDGTLVLGRDHALRAMHLDALVVAAACPAGVGGGQLAPVLPC